MDEQTYEDQSADGPFEAVDISGIIYRSGDKQIQGIQSEDNALRRKQELSKARRITFSSREGNKTYAERKTQERKDSASYDFSKVLNTETDILDRRLSRLREQGYYPDTFSEENYSAQKSDIVEKYYDSEDKL